MGDRGRILVVEDDPDGQEMVATMLDYMNFPIDVVSNAEDAETLLFGVDKVEYQAVIIDLALPGKDGWELLAQIRANPPTAELSCIAVTAFHTSKLREDAIRAGFSAYLPKPLDATALGRQIEDLL